MLAFGTQVRGLKPDKSRWIFRGEKNPQHAFLRRGSKAVSSDGVRLPRDGCLETTSQVVKLFVVSLKKAACNVVESFNTWNVVAKQTSRTHVMRLIW